MGISLEAYRHRIGCFASVAISRAEHVQAGRPDVVPTRSCCGQSKSGKVSFKRSFFDGLHSFKRVGYWLSFLLMVAILTLRCGDVHPHPGPVSREKSDLCTVTPSATYPQCPLCLSVVRDTGALFQHINVSHISQRCFPDANFLSAHDRRLCSDCGFAYEKRFAYCRRSLGCGRTRCRGKMVDARFSPWLLDTSGKPTSTNVIVTTDASSSSEGSSVITDGGITQERLDFVLDGLKAAALISAPLTDESAIFNSVMEDISSLPIDSVVHIPRSVKPLFATVLASELYNADTHGLWGFVRLSMLSKCVLRCPPRNRKKKRVVF